MSSFNSQNHWFNPQSKLNSSIRMQFILAVGCILLHQSLLSNHYHEPSLIINHLIHSTAAPILFVSGAFVHPGLLHTDADFARIRAKLAANESPWKEAWAKFTANYHSQLSYVARPNFELCRCSDTTCSNNFAVFGLDASSAYALGLRYKITGDTAYANHSIYVMNAWSYKLDHLNGNSDVALLAINIYQLVAAGELLMNYPGWAPKDLAQFQNMTMRVFYPLMHYVSWNYALTSRSNWQLSSLASLLAIGVMNDNETIFQEGIYLFKHSSANGAIKNMVSHIHPGNLGQTEESGRDQGHDTLSAALLGPLCEMAWNQGEDLFSYDNYRVLSAFEYVAKGNLRRFGNTFYEMPYILHFFTNSYEPTFATGSIGGLRPEFSIPYHHFVNRLGMAAPYTKMAMSLLAPEGGGGTDSNYDQLGFGTLTYTRDPWTQDVPARGLFARFSLGVNVLSWFGAATGTSYAVGRSTTSGGPYITIATGIRDLLTYGDPIALTAPGVYYYVVYSRHLSGVTLTSAEYRCSLFMTGLIVDLQFNEGFLNTTSADLSGHGWTASFLPGTIWTTSRSTSWGNALGQYNSAYGATLPPGIFSDVAELTINFWMFWQGISGGTQCAFWFGDAEKPNHQLWFTPKYGTQNRFVMSMNEMDGGDQLRGPSSPHDSWVTISMTIAGPTAILYLNGVQQVNSTSWRWSPQDLNLGNTTANLIGSGLSHCGPFIGKIDKFRMWKGAKSADELLQMYNNGE